ncbi:MAG: hypothetical protein KKD86_03925 [Bacteroidetes bacterium]|nr:hypothetical protein [Bacteroidota bacterium]
MSKLRTPSVKTARQAVGIAMTDAVELKMFKVPAKITAGKLCSECLVPHAGWVVVQDSNFYNYFLH